MGIEERLRRLEAEHQPTLCSERHRMRPTTFVEVIHYPDGSEERGGCEPPPLCQRCPDREGEGSRRIRVIEVHRSLYAKLD